MSDKELLQRAYDLGFKYEHENGACVQSVLAAVFDLIGDWNEDVFKASYGLAGGCAMTSQGTCGALSGGVIAICHHFGRTREQFDQGRNERAYKLSKEMYDRFVNEYGSPLCRDVQTKLCGRSYCYWNLEDMEEYRKNHSQSEPCPGVVGNAAMWAVDIIQRERPTSDGP